MVDLRINSTFRIVVVFSRDSEIAPTDNVNLYSVFNPKMDQSSVCSIISPFSESSRKNVKFENNYFSHKFSFVLSPANGCVNILAASR